MREALSRAGSREAARQDLRAVVMVADISGFTVLSEELAARGAAGPEELSRLLNVTFGALVELVYRHGGDVVKFAGDALVAAWPCSEAMTTRAATLAASLALAMPIELGRPAGGRPGQHRVRLRVGIAVGELVLAPVGGELGRWELLVAGAAVAEAAEAQKHSPLGGAAVSAEAWRWLAEVADGEPAGPGWTCLTGLRVPSPTAPLPLQPAEPALAGALRGFVPGSILSRLDAGLSAWVAELRQVTAVFVRLPGLSVRAPPDSHALQAVARAVQGALYRTEGVLDKIVVDEKGMSVLAGFGLPPFAHEDDALRAVRAALAARDALAAEGHSASVGVATGRVFCGTLGGEARCEYTMLGDTVNRAARLMQVAALGEVLCDQATAEAIGDRVKWEPLHAIQLKGVRGLSVPMRPIGVLPRRVEGGQADQMFGRDAERELLVAGVHHCVAEGHGQAVFVIGPPGIGKSRLLSAARAEVAPNCRTLFAAGDSSDQMTPYHVWRAVLAELLGVRGRAGRESLRARLPEELGPELAPFAGLINAVLPLGLPEPDELKLLGPEGRADRTRALVLRLLERAVEAQPLILFLDEAHWFDSASWSLLEAVAEGAPRVHLIVATRTLQGERGARLGRVRALPRCRTIFLGPLDEEAQVALATAILGAPNLPQILARSLLNRAQGNPFYMAELARALRSRDVASTTSPWASLEPGLLPGTVEGALASRIDRLEPAEQVAIKVASVFGRAFTAAELRVLLPGDQDDAALIATFHALEAADLLNRHEADGVVSWSFESALVREAAYGLMTFSQRRGLHQAVAARLEEASAEGAPVALPVLAFHWTRAEVPDRAVAALDAAGEEAARQFLLDETARFYKKALLLAPDAPAADRRRWLLHLGMARLRGGWPDEAGQHLMAALALGGSQTPATPGRRFLSALVEMARFALSSDAAGRTEDPEQQQEARLWLELGWSHYFRVSPGETLYATLRAVNAARALGPSYELGVGYASMCAFCTFAGLSRPSVRFRERTLSVLEQNAEPAMGGVALAVLGAASLASARWEQATDELVRARALHLEAGLLEDRDLAALLLAQVCRSRGDLEGAERWGQEALQGGDRRGSPMVRTRSRQFLGTVALARGAIDAGVTLLEEGAAVADQAGGGLDVASAMGARVARALAAMLSGRRAAGLDDLRAVISDPRLVSASAAPAGRLGEMAGVALLHAWAGAQGAEATEWRSATVHFCRRLKSRSRAVLLHHPLVARLSGAILWREGRVSAAARVWRRGEDEAGRLGLVWDQAMLRAALGEAPARPLPPLPLVVRPERLIELFGLKTV